MLQLLLLQMTPLACIAVGNTFEDTEHTATYLGITLDTKLRWKNSVKKKSIELDIKYRKMIGIFGRHTNLST